MPNPRTPATPRPRPAEPGGGPTVARVPLRRLFRAEHADFWLLAGTTVFMVGFGLVMVLSASFVEAQAADESAFGPFLRQAVFAAVGLPLMLLASRMPVAFWRTWAWFGLGLGAALQLLVFVPGLGYGYGGNRNWLLIGDYSMQPSEFVKVALVVWCAWMLATKRHLLQDWRHVLLPIAPIAGAAILLVLIGNDLGTATIMILLVLGCLFFAGVRLRYLTLGAAALAVLGIIVAVASPSRVQRIRVWLEGCTEEDYSWLCWQSQHGIWALANGGVLGVGLGNSVQKRGWLPEADNDFIFAIIGEELGLIGTLLVLALFVVLTIAFVRILRRAQDDFSRIATGGILVWVIGQAMVNIAVVLGVLPVLGVPLPLISAGGSSLIATLLGIGIVLSFARTQSKVAA